MTMMRAFTVCVAVFELWAASLGRAEEPRVALEEVLKEVEKSNAEVKVFTQKYLAIKQKAVVSRTWEYPLLGIEYTTEPMGSISQMVPFPGKISLKGRIAENESNMAQAELNSRRREVIAQAKRSYWQYLLTDKMIEIYEENIGIVERISSIAGTKYVIGEVAQTDLLKANIELAEMENMLTLLEQERISVQAELNALMNRSPDAPLGRPLKPEEGEVEYSFEELRELALNNGPELRAKEFLYRMNSLSTDLARREWFPDIMFSVKFGRMAGATYMAQAEIPLYYRKQTSTIEMMNREREMAEWELQATKANTLQALRDLWSKYESRKKTVQSYEGSILPLAEQALRVAEAEYRAGRTDFLDLLDSQRRYLEHNIAYYEQLVQRGVFRSELERVIGIELE